MSSKADEDLILILQHPAIKLEAKLQGWNYVLGNYIFNSGKLHFYFAISTFIILNFLMYCISQILLNMFYYNEKKM